MERKNICKTFIKKDVSPPEKITINSICHFFFPIINYKARSFPQALQRDLRMRKQSPARIWPCFPRDVFSTGWLNRRAERLRSIIFLLCKAKEQSETASKRQTKRKRNKNTGGVSGDTDADLAFHAERPVHPLIVLLHFRRADGELLPHPPTPRTQPARRRFAAFSPPAYCRSQKKKTPTKKKGGALHPAPTHQRPPSHRNQQLWPCAKGEEAAWNSNHIIKVKTIFTNLISLALIYI